MAKKNHLVEEEQLQRIYSKLMDMLEAKIDAGAIEAKEMTIIFNEIRRLEIDVMATDEENVLSIAERIGKKRTGTDSAPFEILPFK